MNAAEAAVLMHLTALTGADWSSRSFALAAILQKAGISNDQLRFYSSESHASERLHVSCAFPGFLSVNHRNSRMDGIPAVVFSVRGSRFHKKAQVFTKSSSSCRLL
jgi:hypothetical protein